MKPPSQVRSTTPPTVHLPLRTAILGVGAEGALVAAEIATRAEACWGDCPWLVVSSRADDLGEGQIDNRWSDALKQLARAEGAPATRLANAATGQARHDTLGEGVPPAVRLVFLAAAGDEDGGSTLPRLAQQACQQAKRLLEAPVIPSCLLLLPDPLEEDQEAQDRAREALRRIDAVAEDFEGGRYVIGQRDAEGTWQERTALRRKAAASILQELLLPASADAAGEPGFRTIGLAQARLDIPRAREAIARRLAAGRLERWLVRDGEPVAPPRCVLPNETASEAQAHDALPEDDTGWIGSLTLSPNLASLRARIDEALEAPLARLAETRSTLREEAGQRGREWACATLERIGQSLDEGRDGCVAGLAPHTQRLAAQIGRHEAALERRAARPWRALSGCDRELDVRAACVEQMARDIDWERSPWAWLSNPAAALSDARTKREIEDRLVDCRRLVRRKLEHTRAALALELNRAELEAARVSVARAADRAGALHASCADALDLMTYPELPPDSPPESWELPLLTSELATELTREIESGTAETPDGLPGAWWRRPPEPEQLAEACLVAARRRFDAAGDDHLAIDRILAHSTDPATPSLRTMLGHAVPQLTWDVTRMSDEELAHFTIRRWILIPSGCDWTLLKGTGDWDAVVHAPTPAAITVMVCVCGLTPRSLVLAAGADAPSSEGQIDARG